MQFHSNVIEQGRGLYGRGLPALYRLSNAPVVSVLVVGRLHVQGDGEREVVVLDLGKHCVG